MNSQITAILLLGPTGSGKTPLGNMIESQGLWQRHWLHFDFGATMRDLVARKAPVLVEYYRLEPFLNPSSPWLPPCHAPNEATNPNGISSNTVELISQNDLHFLREVLHCGMLFEDEHFPLVYRLFLSFLLRQESNDAHPANQLPDKINVIFNGLPRHIGQAKVLESIIDIQHVVELRCSPETVWRRIQKNTGGDRTERTDDAHTAVYKKLEIYRQRTVPLLDFYRQKGVNIHEIDLDEETTTPTILEKLARF